MVNRKLMVASYCYMHLLHLSGQKRRKRYWQRKLYQDRSNALLLKTIRHEEDENFRNFTRISPEDFQFLLNSVKTTIERQDTKFRKAITAEERLAVTLRFLATGDSYSSLQYLFKISKQAIGGIIPETCQAIVDCLKEYVKLPSTTEEWLKISDGFNRVWNFPHCLGALDGKHVILQAPIKSGSDFFNYKSQFSIVLLALVDADYNFLYVDVGCQGRISDGGVLKNCDFYKKIENGDLNLPEPSRFEEMNLTLPYFFLADSAFSLSENLLKPFSGIHPKGSTERIFNYRLCRARRVVENAFGILSSVFRVLRKPLLVEPEIAQIVVLATVFLHHFLRKSSTSQNYYTPPNSFDSEIEGEIQPGVWRNDVTQQGGYLLPIKNVPRKSKSSAQNLRQHLAEYFTSSGKLSWQEKYA